ncbi:MAG: sigma-70 family RNA polymerase sigma factor [Deltaproteobacteria bacterium]
MTASVAEFERFRPALTGHCYRMLGSPVDADDAVQETLIRAWRGRERLQEQAAVRGWLYRIATNVCLDALSARKRRARPMEEGPAGRVGDTLTQQPADHWLVPIPDAAVIDAAADPQERAALKQHTRLAFVSALQNLPPKQRAVLLLVEVLDCTAAEVAECLDTTVASVNSALQRARARMASVSADVTPAELSDEQRTMLDRYVAAFEAFDVTTLTSLLRDDATFSMPPFALWLQGPEEVAKWLVGPGCGCRGSRLIRVEANGSPAFAQYRVNPAGGFLPWALIVLELDGAHIAGWNAFLDTETLFSRLGVPASLA